MNAIKSVNAHMTFETHAAQMEIARLFAPACPRVWASSDRAVAQTVGFFWHSACSVSSELRRVTACVLNSFISPLNSRSSERSSCMTFTVSAMRRRSSSSTSPLFKVERGHESLVFFVSQFHADYLSAFALQAVRKFHPHGSSHPRMEKGSVRFAEKALSPAE